ncbi:hypothetical protein AVEN_100323-1 [Araneus ventricosus]|uniref:Uncharacterized protein n=1 Tax=Araneus ventricosus TaxID=182803 RepID=A0A4Y2U0G1_ARAVE|nr:hypothetical protein AVEN_100323-1 [Araneus ventricosus]
MSNKDFCPKRSLVLYFHPIKLKSKKESHPFPVDDSKKKLGTRNIHIRICLLFSLVLIPGGSDKNLFWGGCRTEFAPVLDEGGRHLRVRFSSIPACELSELNLLAPAANDLKSGFPALGVCVGPLKPGLLRGFNMKGLPPNRVKYLPHNPIPCYNLPYKRTEMAVAVKIIHPPLPRFQRISEAHPLKVTVFHI